MVVIAVGLLAVSAVPRLVHGRPMSFPMVLLGLGAAAFALPLGLPTPDPVRYGQVAEYLTEVVVIVALTNAGLRLDRRMSWRSWATTWRLLGVAMPLTIVVVAALAGWLLALPIGAAVLLGAAISPTDPVLAAEVQVGGPGEGSENLEAAAAEPPTRRLEGEDEVRFGLTSEAGLNDGLAFPYTNLAIVLAATASGGDIAEWFAVDVVYKLAVAVAAGVVIGRLFAATILALPSSTQTGRALTGLSALAVTFAAYGATEAVGGYGFLATFIAAHTLRHSNADHEYHASLVVFVEQFERMLIAVVLLALGGYVVRELLDEVTAAMTAFALVVVFVVRPACAAVALVGGRGTRAERAALSFYGIRGVGTFYYVAYALNAADFGDAEALWATVVLVAVLSVLVHGVTASAVLKRFDHARAVTAPLVVRSPKATT